MQKEQSNVISMLDAMETKDRLRRGAIMVITKKLASHVHDAHAHHNITRFTYDTNHVTMMSPAFMFHLCHVDVRLHTSEGENNTKISCNC